MEEEDPIKSKLDGYLQKNASFSNSVLVCSQIAGSFAYNLNVETSDEDMFGVYMAPIENVILGSFKDSICSHDPDFETHEVEKYLLLLEKGNPKVIEPIFTSHLIWKSEDFRELLEIVQPFVLSKHTLTQYRHYAKSQKGDNEETPPKKRYHSIRLALEANRIARGLKPAVFMEGEDRDMIMDFRKGLGTEKEFLEKFETLLKETYECKLEMPEKTDMNEREVEEKLIEMRRKCLIQHPKYGKETLDQVMGKGLIISIHCSFSDVS